VQSDVAEKVAEALRLEFSTPGGGRTGLRKTSRPTRSAQGEFASTKVNKESLLKGIGLYEKAVARLPADFAQCYADLAHAWLTLASSN